MLFALYRSEEDNRKRGLRHRAPARVMQVLLRLMLRWFPDRSLRFASDAGYGSRDLAELAAQSHGRVHLVSKLHPRANLETTRGQCKRTVLRAEPCLFGLYNVVTLLYDQLPAEAQTEMGVDWDGKATVTFSGTITAVRPWLWTSWAFATGDHVAPLPNFPSRYGGRCSTPWRPPPEQQQVGRVSHSKGQIDRRGEAVTEEDLQALAEYVRGLLSELPRKSVEPIALQRARRFAPSRRSSKTTSGSSRPSATRCRATSASSTRPARARAAGRPPRGRARSSGRRRWLPGERFGGQDSAAHGCWTSWRASPVRRELAGGLCASLSSASPYRQVSGVHKFKREQDLS
jgi:hypothetical protein